jgi:hypothetical protein
MYIHYDYSLQAQTARSCDLPDRSPEAEGNELKTAGQTIQLAELLIELEIAATSVRFLSF